MSAPPRQLSAFAKAMRRSHASSKAGTLAAAKTAICQSPTLKPFTKAERAGQPLKSQEWRA
jgi:hypothetical protein